MKNYKRPCKKFYWNPFSFSAVLLPFVFILLFYTLRNQSKLMLWWSQSGLYAVVQKIGWLSSWVPFSLGEFLIVGTALGLVVFLIYRLYACFCVGKAFLTLHHGVFFLAVSLWVWAWMCWLWNPLYYIPSFAERSGLDVSPYPVEELIELTEQFAQLTASLSSQVPRTEEGVFTVPRESYFTSALNLYQDLEKQYPFLERENVRVKSLTLSKLQSVFGFTGVYIPFTGEANINVHTPPMLHPVTIAHEMAHQRLIAPELEANFLAVVACLDSEDVVFQYSGSLFALIQLSNALYSVDPDTWREMVALYFTEELSSDWERNYNYWKSFESPVEDVAKEVYDGFLKSNAQELGIRSYGACVDLLVAYYQEHGILLWVEEDMVDDVET